ncbi:hypothetical protein BDZ88DRAFT_421583 [Geranomyces variabilis]|nr:hypothetical protein BDZ88DRAFT_421583 [Geranomyces variabilis]KAJ3140269.1 hypothetical protein HDU90_008496 [Geranomyces variabilis]
MDRSWGATPPPQAVSKQWGASPPTTSLAPAVPTASPPDDLKGRLGPAVIGAGWAVPPLHKKPSTGFRSAEANASDRPHSGWGPAPASEPAGGGGSWSSRTAPAPNSRRRPSELAQMEDKAVQPPLAQNRTATAPRVPASRGFENASWRSASGDIGKSSSGDTRGPANVNGWTDSQPQRAASGGGWAVSPAPGSSGGGTWDSTASTSSRGWPDARQGSERNDQRTGVWAEPRPTLPVQSSGWGAPPPLPENRNQTQHREFARARDESNWNPSPGWAPTQEVYSRWSNSAAPLTADRTSWHAESAPPQWASGDGWQANHLDTMRGPYRDERDLRPTTRTRDAFAPQFVDDITPEVVSLSALKSDRDFADDFVPSSVISLNELMSDEPATGSSNARSSDQSRQGERQQRDIRKTKSSQVLRDSVDRDGSSASRSVTMGRAAGREARGLNHEMKGVRQGRDPLRGERSHGNLREAATRSANSRGGQLPPGSRPSGRLFGRQMEEVNKAMESFNANTTTAAKPMRNRRSQQELKETSKPTQPAAEIHIKGLPKWVRARELLEVFADYGAILNVGIKATEGDKSSACISYEEPGCAEEAVRALKSEIFFKMSRPLSMKVHYDATASDSLPRSSSGNSAAARAAGDASQSRKPSDPATPLDYKTLHIALIPASVDKSDLEETFAPYGDIKRAQIVARTNKRSFAFVSFKTEQAAEAALQDMKMKRFFGMHELLRVDYAHLAVSKRGGGAAAAPTESAAAERRSSTRRERRAARASSTKDSNGGPASAEPASSVEPADESDSDGSRTDEGKIDEEEAPAAAAESGPAEQANVPPLPVAGEVKEMPSKADENSVMSAGADTAPAEKSALSGGADINTDNGSRAVHPSTLNVTHAEAPRDLDIDAAESDSVLITSPVDAKPAITAESPSPAVQEELNSVNATKPESDPQSASNASGSASQPSTDRPLESSGAAPDAAHSPDASQPELKSDSSSFVKNPPEPKPDASSPVTIQPEPKPDTCFASQLEAKSDASSLIASQPEPMPDATAVSPTADQVEITVVTPEPPAASPKRQFESSLPVDKDMELTCPPMTQELN